MIQPAVRWIFVSSVALATVGYQWYTMQVDKVKDAQILSAYQDRCKAKSMTLYDPGLFSVYQCKTSEGLIKAMP